jgi:hypothetical protein
MNASDFFYLSPVVIIVEKVRARNAGRRSGAPNMYWPHIWWLIQTVKSGFDFIMSVVNTLR